MFFAELKYGFIQVDFAAGSVTKLHYAAKEWISGKEPLFRIGLREKGGWATCVNAFSPKHCEEMKNGAVYTDFPVDLTVTVTVEKINGHLEWKIQVENRTSMVIEWIELARVALKPLKKNGGDAELLIPYNEGALIDDALARESSPFCLREPEYPSKGSYYMFPNMISSQFMAYLSDGHGLYLAAHDPARGVKGVDFAQREDGGLNLWFRLYTGAEAGADVSIDYPVVWEFFDGDWHDGADLYRNWFASELPDGLKKILENPNLPEWYKDSPLVLSYPVRGIHDMDTMVPNKLFPYCNALPLIDEIAKITGSRILVLLMHWEGSAPWAPPYVWPPFGGEEPFMEFLHELHKRGDLLGVYCSGFGYSLQSNLIESYNREGELEARGLIHGMCAGPDGEVQLSDICTAQRSGYDICTASEKGQEILDEAYRPLLESGVDYSQILDQNHGGGQYFCYSREHGHPPVPGAWMTQNMQKLLGGWNKIGGKMLFGCESAAAEPFIGNLLFSDNRFELNYWIGQPVPLYAYLYHEYVRNFMGNQVCCPFLISRDTLCLRMAYSFVAGDCMTIVATPDGDFMNNWGNHDFSKLPDKQRTLRFTANLCKFYKEQAMPYLYAGRMQKPLACECSTDVYALEGNRTIELPDVFTSAWEADGKRAQILVNHTDSPVECRVGDKTVTVEALNAVLIEL